MMFVHAVMEDQYPRGVFPLEGETCTRAPTRHPKSRSQHPDPHLCRGGGCGEPGRPVASWRGWLWPPCCAMPCSASRSLLEDGVGQRGSIFLRCLISSHHGSRRLVSVQEEQLTTEALTPPHRLLRICRCGISTFLFYTKPEGGL